MAAPSGFRHIFVGYAIETYQRSFDAVVARRRTIFTIAGKDRAFVIRFRPANIFVDAAVVDGLKRVKMSSVHIVFDDLDVFEHILCEHHIDNARNGAVLEVPMGEACDLAIVANSLEKTTAS